MFPMTEDQLRAAMWVGLSVLLAWTVYGTLKQNGTL